MKFIVLREIFTRNVRWVFSSNSSFFMAKKEIASAHPLGISTYSSSLLLTSFCFVLRLETITIPIGLK
jgi:hypothetical protein